MNKPSVSCEYGEAKDNSIFCKQVNDRCVFSRWCTTSECLKNSEGYKTCVVRTESMAKPSNNKNVKISEKKEIEKKINDFIIEYFPIIWKKDHAFAIEFYGYGISFHVSEDNYLDNYLIGDTMKIKYKGNIGTTDFEIHPIYE